MPQTARGTTVTPSTRARRARERAKQLAEQDVQAVALAMVDAANITRVKTIPLSRLAEAARSGIGISSVFAIPMINDVFAESHDVHGPSGDLRLIPDTSMTTAMSAMPGWAWAPVDQYTQDGEPWAGDPRGFLRRMEGELARRGLEIRAAVEHEFFAGTRPPTEPLGSAGAEGDPVAAHVGPGYSAEALTRNERFSLSMIQALDEQGLGPQQFHPEYSPGQFEVSVAPRPALEAADVAILVRQTVRSVARAYDLDVSFAPLVLPGLVGNGAHVHYSLWDTAKGSNLFAGGRGPYGMTRRAEAFSAGILRELPALCCVIAPSVPSYERLQPHMWAGAYTAWGYENREASLRFITGMTGTHGAAANMELKCVDGAANPYLAFGAILAAGLAGIDDGLELPAGVDDDPSTMSARDRRRLGIERLPGSLGEAADRLADSRSIRAGMGDLLFEAFLATRRGEYDTYKSRDLTDVVREIRWRY